MNFNDIEELKQNNFEGFISIEKLWEDNSMIPNTQGVYLVLNQETEDIQFLEISVGGFYQGHNPTVSIDILTNKFVPNSLVVYIGKANNLRNRIRQYLSFGQGNNAPHRGGKYIWQLENHQNLIFCWKTIENEEPLEIERHLIKLYKKQFNKNRPFANLRG